MQQLLKLSLARPVPARRSLAAVAAALLLAASSPAFADQAAGRLPPSWFVLPENAPAPEIKVPFALREVRDGNLFARSEDDVGRSVDKIFAATAESLAQSGATVGGNEPPPGAPADWVPWHLSQVSMALGVSTAGTVGLATSLGETAVQVQWLRSNVTRAKRRDTASQPAASESADAVPAADTRADLRLSEYSTPVDVAAQVDRITDAVMATGRVAERDRVHGGLLRAASDLQSVMLDVNAYNDSSWDISRFELDVDISGSGDVSEGFTAGAAVQLHFAWARANYGEPLPEPNDGNQQKRESLRRLLAGIAEDMDTMAHDALKDTDFGLKAMRLGVGLSAKGDFAVAKGKVGITGYVFLTKAAAPANHAVTSLARRGARQAGGPIPLLDAAPRSSHLAYAKLHGIAYDSIPVGDDAGDAVVYYLTHDSFRKGLQQALDMGAFFARRAKAERSSAKPGAFIIRQIQASYAVSVEGVIKIVTLEGQVSLSLILADA